MVLIDQPLYAISLNGVLQGFETPDIEYNGSEPIGVVPVIGTEEQAHVAIAGLSRVSGVPVYSFRILKYELTEILEG